VAGRWRRIGVIVRTTRRGIVFNPRPRRRRRGATAVTITFIVVAAERNR
jgi:hypothetical protein